MKGINDKAKKYADNQLCSLDKYTEWNNPFSKLDVEIAYKDGYAQGQKDSDTFKSFKNGYEHSALECAKDIKVLTKENAELKEKIEKMKRPQNCKHSGSDYCMTNGYCVCDKWELAE